VAETIEPAAFVWGVGLFETHTQPVLFLAWRDGEKNKDKQQPSDCANNKHTTWLAEK
jgi:hypothetical protein